MLSETSAFQSLKLTKHAQLELGIPVDVVLQSVSQLQRHPEEIKSTLFLMNHSTYRGEALRPCKPN
jgi:hypothetical protein